MCTEQVKNVILSFDGALRCDDADDVRDDDGADADELMVLC